MATAESVRIARLTETQFSLPDGKQLRRVLLQQETTLADIYWFKLIQYLGTPQNYDAGVPALYSLADFVTDLDPRYGYAYIGPGLVLSAHKRFDESNRLLEKGVPNSQRWEIPFYLSFNYWFELKDLEKGAAWMEVTSRTKGSPPWVLQLLHRLYSSAGQIELGIRFTETMIQSAASERDRDHFRRRLEDLRAEQALQFLEKACDEYQRRFGRPPWELKELEGTILQRLPDGPFEISPFDGRPATFLLEKRIKLGTLNDIQVTATPLE